MSNSRATLIDSVAYLLAYGKTFKNTACACYSSAAINRVFTLPTIFNTFYGGMICVLGMSGGRESGRDDKVSQWVKNNEFNKNV